MRIPLLFMAAVTLAFQFVLFLGFVPTESMEPTLKRNSYIIGTRIFSKLDTGDVIIFWHEGHLLVKRIAAVPGETVERGSIRLLVPDDSYYVLGDNKENSLDSRYWSEPFVHRKNIEAKLIGFPPYLGCLHILPDDIIKKTDRDRER